MPQLVNATVQPKKKKKKNHGQLTPASQYFMGSQAYLILLHFADIMCFKK